jgi:hypothetical protein
MSMKKKTDTEAVLSEENTRSVHTTSGFGALEKAKKSPEMESTAVRMPARERRAENVCAESASTDLLSDLGNLPRSYGEEVMFLVAQDPHWLFTYWDIDISRHPGGPCILRVEDASGTLEQEIEVSFETRNWYIPVKNAGGSYVVEIGFQRHGKWNPLARSPIVATPRDSFSESEAFDFATLPMHISFQRLVENVSHSFASSEELLPTLIKLQQTLPLNLSSGFPLEVGEREILQALLGSEILAGFSSGQWSSEELHSVISHRLRESFSSSMVEEFFSRLPLWNSESALFSGFQKLSTEVSSSSLQHGSAASAEMLVSNLSSWLTGLITSWGGGESSETLISLSAPTSWSGVELSSASEFAARAALSSWLAESASSWKGTELSSQALAAISSWSSEIMAAQGFAASSWSASQN